MNKCMDQVNDSLKEFHVAIYGHPYACEMVRLSIIGFSDDAIEHLNLANVLDSKLKMPTLRARNGTSYAAVFSDLRTRIESDFTQLHNEGFAVVRPTVYFLSDGAPTDKETEWREALKALKSEQFNARPNILSFGFNQAVASVILEIASHKEYAFIAEGGTDVGAALSKFFESLTRSVIQSSQAVAEGVEAPDPITKPDGYRYAYDVIDGL